MALSRTPSLDVSHGGEKIIEFARNILRLFGHSQDSIGVLFVWNVHVEFNPGVTAGRKTEDWRIEMS